MATVREGNKGVLLVVDVQVGVMREAWDAARIIKNLKRPVERARAQNVPVIWVQHADRDLAWENPNWLWVPELTPAEGETLIHRQFNSSFEQATPVSLRPGPRFVGTVRRRTWCVPSLRLAAPHAAG
jgi:nicotinamidase-related amidase